MPVGTYNATKTVELKRERLFEVSTHYVRCTRKNTVFDDFFHKLTKRITSESDTVGKIGRRNVRELFSTLVTDTLTKFSALTLILVVITKMQPLCG